MSSSSPAHLVLVGGGHSHSVALDQWRRNPHKFRPIAEITLITPNEKTVYSGAVPGYLEGLWDRRDCEFAIGSLARSLDITVKVDEVVGLDLERQLVLCRTHAPIAFDLLSLNLGSVPRLPIGVVASDRIIPMKPMDKMLDRLEHYFRSQLSNTQSSKTPSDQVVPKRQVGDPLFSVAIVGGGLGGVEVALSLKSRWGNRLKLALICRGDIASTQDIVFRKVIMAELQRRSIQIYRHTTVEAPQEHEQGVTLQFSSGETYDCDVSLWATEAIAPSWLQETGLSTDDRGFVQVDRTLRSLSHPQIFASGDIASYLSPHFSTQNTTDPVQSLPKAGVFAVRQGTTIGQNLTRSLSQKSLKPFQDRSQYLSLISLGDRRAVATYGSMSLTQSPWRSMLWHWKRSIDAQFVNHLNSIPNTSHKLYIDKR